MAEQRYTINGIIAGIPWYFTGDEHIDECKEGKLEEHARERISDMIKEGYNSGELIAELYNEETDTEDYYRGWWRGQY